jgi:hypothetical protein
MSNMDPIETPGWTQVLARCWSEQVVHMYRSRSFLSHICFWAGFSNPVYLLELKPKYTNNTASSASCPELHTEKLTVRVVWEQTFLIEKWFIFQYCGYSMYSNCICILTLSWKDIPILVLPVGDFLVRYRNWQGDTEPRVSFFFAKCRTSIVYSLYYLHQLAMCYEYILMWSFYIDFRSVLFFPLMTCHYV